MSSKLVVVDVEADGPYPIDYSMVCFGAVIVDENLDRTFYGKTPPISDLWIPEALAVSGITREEHLAFIDYHYSAEERIQEEMKRFATWLKDHMGDKQPIFISDNPAFDWQWINTYFHKFYGKNPFGFSAQRIGDKFQGYYNDMYYKWKKHRVTAHTHNPVDDAKGNAEALLYLKSQGFKLQT